MSHHSSASIIDSITRSFYHVTDFQAFLVKFSRIPSELRLSRLTFNCNFSPTLRASEKIYTFIERVSWNGSSMSARNLGSVEKRTSSARATWIAIWAAILYLWPSGRSWGSLAWILPWKSKKWSSTHWERCWDRHPNTARHRLLRRGMFR